MSRSRGYLEAERKLKAATNNRLRSYWQGRMRHIESGSIDGGSDVTESNDATSNYAENEEKGITNFESDGYESIHDEAVSSDFRSDLLESLDMIGHGSFAASGPLADINPGLYVEGLGKIGLPLSERDAKALALVCNRAPFGKGSETFVDTAVRKTWEVNPDKVRFRNSKWQSQVDHAVIKVTEGLGIIGGPGTVRAELHKLLLYESGAFFDTHRDTEKALGMIATMVLSLPSEHTGGEVVLSLNNQKRKLHTQDTGEFGMKWLAWYTDVNHAVKPVLSGYRLVLTYNLIRRGSNVSTSIPPSVQFNPVRKLELAIAKWQTETDREGHLLYMLEHQYSEANFGLDSLKGKDQQRVRNLSDAAKKQDVCVYFAHFEHTVSGGVDEDDPCDRYGTVDIHEIEDEYDSEWRILTLFTSDGCNIAKDLDMDPEDFIEDIYLDEERPDYEDFEGWTGNEGANTIHFYRRSCIVMFPREWRHHLLNTASSVVIEKWAELAFNDLDQVKNSPSQTTIEELLAISRKASNLGLNSARTDPVIFVDLALRLDKPQLLKAAIGKGLEVVTCQKLGSLGLRLLDKDWLLEIQIALSNSSGPKRFEAINALVVAAADKREDKDLEQSLIRLLPKTWNYKHDETEEDAKILASLCTKFGEVAIRGTLLPIAKKSTNITFLQNLAHNVSAKVTSGEISSETAKGFCDQIFANIASSIRKCSPFLDRDWGAEPLREGDLSESLSWGSGDNRYNGTKVGSWDFDRMRMGSWDNPYNKTRLFSARKFVALVETCEAVHSSSSVNKLLSILTDISRKPNKAAFSDFLLPVLESLPSRYMKDGPQRYVDLFRCVISSYTNHFVPTRAKRIQDWSAPRRGCHQLCQDCKDLDRFLTAIDQSIGRFAIVTPRRKHLEQRLLNSECRVSTDKRGSPYKLVVEKTNSISRDDVESLQKTKRDAANEIFQMGRDRLRTMLGEEQYRRLHKVLDLPYTQVPVSNGAPIRAPLNDVPENAAANTQQGNKRGHCQAFGGEADSSKRVMRVAEIIDLEAEN